VFAAGDSTGLPIFQLKENAVTHNKSLNKSLLCAVFILASLFGKAILAAETCQPLSEPTKAALTAYVQKKYKLTSVPVTVAEDNLVPGTCYRELKFRSQSAQKAFAVTLYLPPDQKYLVSGLFDLSIDPAEEERKKELALRDTLTRGSFPSMGPVQSKVTIVEFGDYQCPYCSRAAEVLKTFLATPEGKNVRFVYRHFPLSFHPWAKPAAEATACLNFQGAEKFWALHDWIFENQKLFTPENAQQKLLERVRTIQGVDLTAYQNCMDNAMSAGVVDKDFALGNASAVHGTPTFFINGRQAPGIKSADDLRILVAQAQQESCPGGKCAESAGVAASAPATANAAARTSTAGTANNQR
jgi:protein-disulfide isomerase